MDVMLGGIPNLILLPVPGVHPALKESSAFSELSSFLLRSALNGIRFLMLESL